MPADDVRWVCVHQPCYLPWLGLFHKIHASSRYVVLDDVQLSHRTWINRVYVAGPNGKLLLTVPVHFSLSEGTTVRDVRIDASKRWQRKHAATIRQNYAKAAHADALAELLALTFETGYEYLMDLDLAGMRWVLDRFGIETPLCFSSDLDVGDVQGSERLARLVATAGGGGYFSGAGSDGYLDESVFGAAGLAFARQEFHSRPYSQSGTDTFVPGLSVIDAIANVGVGEAASLVREQPGPGAGSAR